MHTSAECVMNITYVVSQYLKSSLLTWYIVAMAVVMTAVFGNLSEHTPGHLLAEIQIPTELISSVA